jgi:tRNA (guanine-N7-)-methyltransferase
MVARAVKPGGIWRIASDDPTYQAWVRECMGEQPFFILGNLEQARPPGWPPTRYEAKALREGRQPLYWEWVRR